MAAPVYLPVCRNKTETIDHDDVLQETSIHIVIISSCCVSALGVLYLVLPREGATSTNNQKSHRSRLLTGPNLNKIIWFIVAANLFGDLGLFVRAVSWLTGCTPQTDIGSQTFCVFLTIWIQYFFLCTICWHFVYAVEAFLTGNNKNCASWLQYTLGWVIPGVLTAVAGWLTYHKKFDTKTKTGVLDLIFLVPVVVIMLVNPILLHQASRAARRTLTGYVGRYTMYERRIIDAIKLKFICIMGTFTVIWLPNLIGALLQYVDWEEEQEMSEATAVFWMIMAVLNPFQAMLNALVFWGWPGTNLFRPSIFKTNTLEFTSDNNINRSSSMSGSEIDPLLSFRRNMQRS